MVTKTEKSLANLQKCLRKGAVLRECTLLFLSHPQKHSLLARLKPKFLSFSQAQKRNDKNKERPRRAHLPKKKKNPFSSFLYPFTKYMPLFFSLFFFFLSSLLLSLKRFSQEPYSTLLSKFSPSTRSGISSSSSPFSPAFCMFW